MEMKDKIYKHHHKKGFYTLKKVGIYSSIVLGAFVLVAIPVSMVRSIVNKDNKVTELNEESVNTIQNNIDLLSF